ncbi:Reverse transcriptase (RNA-dependent DNA polymerase) [Maioricimonas rarisocia]|uniref:RNA-directed DNA polymerase n=1 Tax=Maioricimonas rarisocia TaxID=2528026 RepID=A0A517Z244_9PLAN|nr:reverse transcriptase family protein [Maioricimonas rarisocia]QDU36553.1 Reverse transcriptase (RNA-dependent DNA polymerase) [Maioricimonas rarisocia]
MGLITLLKRILFGSAPSIPHAGGQPEPAAESTGDHTARVGAVSQRPSGPVRLAPLRYQSSLVRTPPDREHADGAGKPYRCAHIDPRRGGYLDLSTDGDARWLEYYGLPHIATPEQLAVWLQLPLGKVGWLTDRFCQNHRPQNTREAHYHYHWLAKRSGGHRLIEAPKSQLKQVQQQILREILCRVPPHTAAHGFTAGRSIRTNARPHVGQRVLIKFDLEDFYPSCRYARVVAIYRSLGYCREVALWLARLTTSAAPANLRFPDGNLRSLMPYLPRHLPQGAPTSPALANLSAYSLDVRLAGLAARYHLKYTRYADDLTFSGDGHSIPALREILPLITRIVRDERFRVNRKKRKVIRNNQRQTVTGVVVNQHLNIRRDEFDRLKAILHNCRKHGPASQNRDDHPDFAAHLRGRIAHVMQLNRHRGEKLLAMYDQIDWAR